MCVEDDWGRENMCASGVESWPATDKTLPDKSTKKPKKITNVPLIKPDYTQWR